MDLGISKLLFQIQKIKGEGNISLKQWELSEKHRLQAKKNLTKM